MSTVLLSRAFLYLKQLDEEEELLTLPQIARILHVDYTTARRWVITNIIPSITLPHTHKNQRVARRIRRCDLAQILALQKKGLFTGRSKEDLAYLEE